MKQLVAFVLLFFVASSAFGEENRFKSMRMMDYTRSFSESMEDPPHTQYNLESVDFAKSSDLRIDINWRPRWRLLYVERKVDSTWGIGKDEDNIVFVEGSWDFW